MNAFDPSIPYYQVRDSFYLNDLSTSLISAYGVTGLTILGNTTFNNIWLIDKSETFKMSDSITDPDFGVILNLKYFIGFL